MSITPSATTGIAFLSSFEDRSQIAALYRAVALGRRPPEEIARAFRNSKYKVFVVDRGRLVGAGRAFGDEVDCAVICDLAVHPEVQGRGLGERMLENLKHEVRHHLRIILYAKPGKEDFYLKRGFRQMKTAMLTSFLVSEETNRQRGMIA